MKNQNKVLIITEGKRKVPEISKDKTQYKGEEPHVVCIIININMRGEDSVQKIYGLIKTIYELHPGISILGIGGIRVPRF